MNERTICGCCATCQHEWIVARHPMEAGLVAKLAENATCPACASGCVTVAPLTCLSRAEIAALLWQESMSAEIHYPDPHSAACAIRRCADQLGVTAEFLAHDEGDASAPQADPVRDAVAMPRAWLDVMGERSRQLAVEGWTEDHDDKHDDGQLAWAAVAYAAHASSRLNDYLYQRIQPQSWPWEGRWWKPTNQRHDLVKAGALIIAEIERLDRRALAGEKQQ